MTWTYSVASLTTPLMQVRRLIGDVISNDPQIQDEEINFALTQRPSVYGAAADCCRYIAAQYSRKVDTVTTDLRQLYSSQAKSYAQRAREFDAMASSRGAGLPYAGGISISDKANQEQDGDRVQPQFSLGMDDSDLPLAPDDSPASAQDPLADGV